MDADHEAAFEHLTEELDPYHEFLRFDHVMAEVDDPDAWRAEIRRQARRDKISIRSFAWPTRGGLYRVWAGKVRGYDLARMAWTMHLMDVQREASDHATLRGHDVRGWIRVRDDEAATRCSRCGGRVYVNSANDPPILAGEVFETGCT